MTSPGRQFNLHIQFAAHGWARPAMYEEFLMAMPGLLKGMAYNEVDFEVLSYERIAQTNLLLSIVVFPPPLPADILEQAQRLGLRDPIQTAASTAIMLWLRRLQRPGTDRALHVAWRNWCAFLRNPVEEDAKSPLYLHCFGLRAVEHPAEPVERPTEPVNLTGERWVPRRSYDGSTEAST